MNAGIGGPNGSHDISTTEPQANDFEGLEGLIGSSPAMLGLADVVRRVAPMQSAVLIQGETGTGKELVARKIHENSTRSQHPFVAFNAAAIPEGLAEAELFGHVKGAFTAPCPPESAGSKAADRGTLFIDELSSNVAGTPGQAAARASGA
jgi:transcriptional regulator with GAF, ATPase, and Fis domain